MGDDGAQSWAPLPGGAPVSVQVLAGADDPCRHGRRRDGKIRGLSARLQTVRRRPSSVAAPDPSEQVGLLYDDHHGCGRGGEDAPCASRTCSFCWRNRGTEGAVVRKCVTVSNHWGGAPAEVSAGTGTIRGSPIADAGDDAGWARSTTSRANDVEIYLTQDAQESGTHGLEAKAIGRVAYFFEHQGNDWRRGDGGDIPPG